MKESRNRANWQSKTFYGAAAGAALFFAYSAGYAVRAQSDGYFHDGARTPVSDLVRTADNHLIAAANAGGTRATKAPVKPYETLDEVRRAIKENFVRTKVSDQELTYGAIRGMLHSLGDRFTRFLTPEEYATFNEQTNAEFVGIGARLDIKDQYQGSTNAKPFGSDRPYIVETMENSPAQKAGLKKDDVILAIDGHNTNDMSADTAVNYIRGASGTKLTLKVERNVAAATATARDATRDAAFKTLDIVITRGSIEVHPVKLEWLPNRIAWLKLDEFNKKSEDEIETALKKVKAGPDGQGAAKGLIFDMRDNPGGLLDSAVEIGSHFIPAGPIVYTKERNGSERPYNANPKLFLGLKVPTVVMINNYSASAAEIVTGALKDKNAATVLGENSFGKASVQVLVELKDGGALVITTAKYLTPAKRDISDKGISPDIVVKASPGDQKDGRGAQLQRAVAFLEGKPTTTNLASNPIVLDDQDGKTATSDVGVPARAIEKTTTP